MIACDNEDCDIGKDRLLSCLLIAADDDDNADGGGDDDDDEYTNFCLCFLFLRFIYSSPSFTMPYSCNHVYALSYPYVLTLTIPSFTN